MKTELGHLASITLGIMGKLHYWAETGRKGRKAHAGKAGKGGLPSTHARRQCSVLPCVHKAPCSLLMASSSSFLLSLVLPFLGTYPTSSHVVRTPEPRRPSKFLLHCPHQVLLHSNRVRPRPIDFCHQRSAQKDGRGAAETSL